VKLFCSRFVLATSMALACLANSDAAEPAAQDTAVKAKPKITLGKETTNITEPLRPDGYPDYVAALNRRMSQGVTVENNAAVLLAKGFGPGILQDGTQDETYKLLGIEPLPKEGDYFISRDAFARRWKSKRPADAPPISDEEVKKQFEVATKRPWTRNEFPVVADWMAVNEGPLKLAVEATKRPRYFWPYVMLQDEIVPTIISVLLEHVQQCREITNVLASRAMLRIAEKDLDGACTTFLRATDWPTRLALDTRSLNRSKRVRSKTSPAILRFRMPITAL
jgi:hypothetical protein